MMTINPGSPVHEDINAENASSNALKQCEALLNRRIKLPIRLPRVVVLSKRIVEPWSEELSLTFGLAALDISMHKVVVPTMPDPCGIRLRRFDTEDIGEKVVLIHNGEDELWVGNDVVGSIVTLIISPFKEDSPSEFTIPIAYYTWRGATDVFATASLRDLMLLSLFVVKNPWVIRVLPKTIKEIFGDRAFGVEAIAEAGNIASTNRELLKLLRAIGTDIFPRSRRALADADALHGIAMNIYNALRLIGAEDSSRGGAYGLRYMVGRGS